MPSMKDPRLAKYDERVRAMVALTRGPRVLHVGACGNLKPTPKGMKHFAQAALVEAGFSVLATDVNEDGLRWMNEEMGYEVAYLDAERIPPDGEKFDTIFAGELIEHLPNPGLFLEGCARRLKEGGRLVLSTPQPFTLLFLAVYSLRYPTGCNPDHTCWFDRQTLEQLLAKTGFEMRRIVFVDDLRMEDRAPSFHLLAAVWKIARRLLPARFRTTMVVAAQPGRVGPLPADEARDSWRH